VQDKCDCWELIILELTPIMTRWCRPR
jgi:hypothetical protein